MWWSSALCSVLYYIDNNQNDWIFFNKRLYLFVWMMNIVWLSLICYANNRTSRNKLWRLLWLLCWTYIKLNSKWCQYNKSQLMTGTHVDCMRLHLTICLFFNCITSYSCIRLNETKLVVTSKKHESGPIPLLILKLYKKVK